MSSFLLSSLSLTYLHFGFPVLEVYALEIQMYSELKDYRKLKVCFSSPLDPSSYEKS